MSSRRFYNPYLPQTLTIAQILLYINAVFGALAMLSPRFSLIGRLILLVAVWAQGFGAYGIANEKRAGYYLAIFASFLPLLGRIVSVIQVGASLTGNLRFILLSGSILNVLFEYALIALLLHPQSTQHQKIWFR
ncbi:MAG: hypothetical protein V9F03_11750 [Microthrixaceae bacterium]